MSRHALLLLIAGTCVVAAASTCALAQNSQRFGDYEVHYNALATSALGAAMADKYAITRSARSGMLNIAVHRIGGDGAAIAVPAEIRAEAVNLTGQKSPVRIREIAGEDVSYIGLFDVKGPDTYTFTLSITPQGATQAFTLRFNQNFTGG